MVDETLILRKLSELDEYSKQIMEYEKITVGQYSHDWKIQRIIERTLQMMVETCVDIASHIIADRGFRVPKSYSDTFKVLHEENIVGGKLYSALEKMAKFTPTLQKPEGFRVKATEGEVVVLYFEPSATQNLKSSGFPSG